MDDSAALHVGLPEPLERRARFGPFASGADAVKFALWAAVGALVASVTLPALWIPFLAGGFWVSAHRVDGRTPDERLLTYARWRLRPRSKPSAASPAGTCRSFRPLGRSRGAGLLRLSSGRWIALLRAGGVPLRYLPRGEAERFFDAFRSLLRATEDGLYIRAGVEPFPARPFLPLPFAGSSDAEADAWSGYEELVRQLTRRRFRRRVWVAIPGPPVDSPTSASRARSTAIRWLDGLRVLGVRCECVSGPALEAAREAFGWERKRAGTEAGS